MNRPDQTSLREHRQSLDESIESLTTRVDTANDDDWRDQTTHEQPTNDSHVALGAGAGVVGGAVVGMFLGGPPGAVVVGAIGGVVGAVAASSDDEGDDGYGDGPPGGIAATNPVHGGVIAGPAAAVTGGALGTMDDEPARTDAEDALDRIEVASSSRR